MAARCRAGYPKQGEPAEPSGEREPARSPENAASSGLTHDHGAGAAQIPSAEAGEEQDGCGGLGAEPGAKEGRSRNRTQEGTHRAAAEA